MALNLFGKSKKQSKAPVSESQVTEVKEIATPTITAPVGSVLKRYFVSEKSARGFAMNQYTFEVDRRATKTEVRDAVERGYKVDVVSVNMVRLPKKSITLGRHRGTKGGIKKAIVTLKSGQSIAQAQP
ncbi:MAG: 50S ribosomal protein L23 [Candidatus Yanofskybacteria bacterium]|nr:50S ribosomal protein L23 [Candidatus Yanofskybacteria bacterium]